jgi:hypothetical protein
MSDPAVAVAYRSAMEVISAAEPDVAEAIVGELESQRVRLRERGRTQMGNLLRRGCSDPAE